MRELFSRHANVSHYIGENAGEKGRWDTRGSEIALWWNAIFSVAKGLSTFNKDRISFSSAAQSGKNKTTNSQRLLIGKHFSFHFLTSWATSDRGSFWMRCCFVECILFLQKRLLIFQKKGSYCFSAVISRLAQLKPVGTFLPRLLLESPQ